MRHCTQRSDHGQKQQWARGRARARGRGKKRLDDGPSRLRPVRTVSRK
jgi:hypothetical protein